MKFFCYQCKRELTDLETKGEGECRDLLCPKCLEGVADELTNIRNRIYQMFKKTYRI